MARILCIRLFGPMASWGTLSSGCSVRDTARHPSRGAILGLAGAALGIRRDNEAGLSALSSEVTTAVASHGPRRIRSDFRTVQTVEGGKRKIPFTCRAEAIEKGLHIHTTLSDRFHVEDGLWRIFLGFRNGGGSSTLSAEALQSAFTRPGFELYLGRREFPLALPPGPEIHEGDLADVLDVYAPVPTVPDGKECRQLAWAIEDLNRSIVGNGSFDLCWERDFPGAPEKGRTRMVVDDPRSRSAWRFAEREELYSNCVEPKNPVAHRSLTSQFFI